MARMRSLEALVGSLIIGSLLVGMSSAQAEFSKEDQGLIQMLSPGWEEGWEDYLDQEINFTRPDANITLPEIGEMEDVRYLLWTRSNPDEPYVFNAFNKSLVDASPLNPSLYTYIKYHGFGSSGYTSWVTRAKDELLKKLDCNVISVDYSTVIPSPFYVRSVLNVYRTANLTAALLDWLCEEYGLQYSRVHLAGHSLGAHTAGMTGLWANGKVDRVTGIDPAGPLFYSQNDTLTISPKSGSFVDNIHANGCFLLYGCLGMARPLGHVDFYPNGGVHQPGCVRRNGTKWEIMDMLSGCSHHRSVELWVESIAAVEPQNKTFWSWPCNDWDTFASGGCARSGDASLQMGLRVQRGHSGEYYLTTADESPFALGRASSVPIFSFYTSILAVVAGVYYR